MTTKIAMLVLLGCAGCAATVWTHPTKPQSALATDDYACEKETLAMYPQVLVEVDRNGGEFKDHKDLNENQRRDARERCLEARGWSQR
jgi:hypothetical protein